MDPIGLALENFDGVGRWRTTESGVRSTRRASSSTARRSTATSLREALLSYPDAFVQTMTEKLLMYGVGRDAHHYDMPVVRAIVTRDARASRLSILVARAGDRQERAVSDEGARRGDSN